MDTNILIPGIVSAAIATGLAILTLVKTELIKSFVSKISGSKYSMVYIVFAILLVTILSFFLTRNFVMDDSAQEQTETERSDAEIYKDIAVESVEFGIDKFQDVKKNKETKDSVYESMRERQWVYQIGDVVTDEDLLFSTYEGVSRIDGINVFEASGNTFFLFKDSRFDEYTMHDSLDSFKSQFDDSHLKCKVIDLVSLCDRKEKILRVDDLKIKKNGERIFLPCYECGKH